MEVKLLNELGMVNSNDITNLIVLNKLNHSAHWDQSILISSYFTKITIKFLQNEIKM